MAVYIFSVRQSEDRWLGLKGDRGERDFKMLEKLKYL